MHIIEQKLVVRDWPLKEPGDEAFFGYIVALGVFPGDWDNGSMFRYADFAYSDSYTRYRLPNDATLLNELAKFFNSNFEVCGSGQGIYGKVWVFLTKEGYKVDCKRRLKSAAGGARKVPHLPSKGNWIFRSPSSC